MKKKIFISISISIIFLIILGGCTKKTSSTPSVVGDKTPSNEDEISQVEKQEKVTDITEEEIEADDPQKEVSPLDGKKYYKEDLLKRPVAVSIDNHPGARWQAGLSKAEIIYEFEVEHPYTRYLCVFLANEPERVGPVRSARPYIIYYALENDAIFVHVGGSQDAFNEISNLLVPNIDGLYSGAMWRYYDTNKVAPHNMYTTLKSIREEAVRKGYKGQSSYKGYIFNDKDTDLSLKYIVKDAKNLKIIYNKNNSTSYKYDENIKLYFRFKDGEAHIDELNNEQLTTKNIIIIEAYKETLDNAGRLHIGTIGTGKGIYITDGQYLEITWEKKSERDRTKFYINNEELKLNPGNSWIQVVSSLKNLIIE